MGILDGLLINEQINKLIECTTFSDINDKISELLNSNKKLVHYTSAIVAREIIEKEELWLRKTIFMNDYSEITYGKQCLENLLNEPEIIDKLNNLLKNFPIQINGNNLDILKKVYHDFVNDVEKRTYISCLSEHLLDEDNIGRLSMWRAYGNSSGIALVINPKFLEKESIILGNLFITIPVIYSEENFKKIFIKILENIEKYIDRIKELNIDTGQIYNNIALIMYIYVISLKHKGFWEEREWRIILSHLFNKNISYIPAKTLKRTIENIKENPEVIYKINLKEFSFINPSGESLLEKIIIGPTANSEILIESFSEMLKNKGFDNEQIKNMITVSNIPLRY